MKTHRHAGRRQHPVLRGFTLLELLVVMVIIGILAALTLGAFRFAQESAARNKTIAAHAAIKSALEQYKEKFGEYPEPAEASSSDQIGGSNFRIGGAEMLYQAITGDGSSAIELNSGGDQSSSDGEITDAERENTINGNLPKTMIHQTDRGKWILVDGWTRPFQYSKGDADTLNSTSYDLWSFGNMPDNGRAAYSITAKKDMLMSGSWIKNW